MNGVCVAVAAFTAIAIEVAEAALVVLMGAGRGHRRAPGPPPQSRRCSSPAPHSPPDRGVLALIPIDVLRQLVGGALLLLGIFWVIGSIVAPDAAAAELTHEMQTGCAGPSGPPSSARKPFSSKAPKPPPSSWPSARHDTGGRSAARHE